jgi:hypothetical protein
VQSERFNSNVFFACPLIVKFFFTHVPTLLAQLTTYLFHPCYPPTLLTQGTYLFIFFKIFFLPAMAVTTITRTKSSTITTLLS